MIARIWTGAVRTDDADAYAAYMDATGVAAYRATPGNRGVWMLRRDEGEHTEFAMYTLWDDMDAVRAFAGADPEQAVFYPEDDRYLTRRDLTVQHYDVAKAATPVSSG